MSIYLAIIGFGSVSFARHLLHALFFRLFPNQGAYSTRLIEDSVIHQGRPSSTCLILHYQTETLAKYFCLISKKYLQAQNMHEKALLPLQSRHSNSR